MFKLETQGEKIVKVDFQLGFAFRGIETLSEQRNIIQAIYLFERTCGICSHSHAMTFVHAVEAIGHIEPPPRANYLRSLVAEIERVHSHLLFFGVMARNMGFDAFFMYLFRVRENIMQLFEQISGNRIHHSINILGGVRRDLTPDMVTDSLKVINQLETKIEYIKNVFRDISIEKRTRGVGLLTRQDAEAFSVVGPTARGSGLQMDLRKDDPYAAYGDLTKQFSICISDKQDILGRIEVRLLELDQSLRLIEFILNHLPQGPIAVNKKPLQLLRTIPAGEALARIEAPRGELLYFLKLAENQKISRVKVRTPTFANVLSLQTMAVGNHFADLPLILTSIDPCVSCMDR